MNQSVSNSMQEVYTDKCTSYVPFNDSENPNSETERSDNKQISLDKT